MDLDGLTGANTNDPHADAADLVMEMERYRQLYAAINKLSEAQRRRLLLHFSDNLTYQKIADLEGLNQGTIARSVKRALIQLKKHLSD